VSADFWPWWWGGLAVGAVATLYPLLGGRLLGVSSLYASLFEKSREPEPALSELEALLLAATEAEFGPSAGSEPEPASRLARLRSEAERFRPLFLVGMLLGPALFLLFTRDFRVAFTLGSSFDLRYGEAGVVPILVLLGSGALIGFGTRLAGGCTSGHGISGVARAERGSLLTTLVFWGTALGVAWAFTAFRAL
jgi:uncharacterized membrane protein YedE/YeeE